MRFLRPATVLYAAMVGETIARFGVYHPAAPALLLWAGLSLSRNYGIVWAAMSGLLIDALAGRLLGVTMMVATLAALLGNLFRSSNASVVTLPAAFLCVQVCVIEFVSRILSHAVPPSFDLLRICCLIGITTGLADAILNAGSSVTWGILGYLRKSRWQPQREMPRPFSR